MKLLLLGGPRFLGRATTDAALARGHELTFFNRGRTNPELYPDLERLTGDRADDLTALRGRSFDAVIDTSGYVPHVVRASAELLSGSGLYCFVSSISVYADFSTAPDEHAALSDVGDAPVDRLTDDFSNYGALKALCEEAVREQFGERSLVVRPGLIVGRHDPTGRFSYWPHRVARGGEVVVPAPEERTVQFIDARDLGEWMVRLCERGASGTFNATGSGVSWYDLIESCGQVTGAKYEPVWIPDAFLLEHGVREWTDLPLWIADPAEAGANSVPVGRALAAGLASRALDDVVAGALEAPLTESVGLDPEREAAVILDWHDR